VQEIEIDGLEAHGAGRCRHGMRRWSDQRKDMDMRIATSAVTMNGRTESPRVEIGK
jgi:hypothetical protein